MVKKFSPLFFLLLLLVLFFPDITFLGKTLSTSSLLPGTTPGGPCGFSGHRPLLPFSFDTAGNAWVNEPNPYIIRAGLKQGQFPAWNPREGLGMPLIANLNNEVLNPLKLFLNLFPGPFLQDVFYLLRLLVMGAFTYLFLREIKLSPLPALFGSAFFMLSGYSVWWINLQPLSTVMYLPAVFYFYEGWSGKNDAKSAFLMSLFLCFALLAGKMPDVIMGLCLLFLHALWKGFLRDSLRGLWRDGGRVIIGTVSGALMASVALLPFFELYEHASPLARAIRTGAASHTIPLITSVSLFQPLLLGSENYFYGSWLRWTPEVIMPHASMLIMAFSLYGIINRSTLMKIVPYLFFSLSLFCVVFGLLPSDLISKLPVFRSIEFLKYNAMLYFSLAVISASAFDELLQEKGNRRRLFFSLFVVSLVVLTFFLLLCRESPPEMKYRLVIVLLLSLSAMLLLGLTFHLSKTGKAFGMLAFSFLILELFLYMPKDHPDRFDPLREPPYYKVISGKTLSRVTGDGSSVPPLVSSAVGFYDMRAISVLIPRDYYAFSENLAGFSVPSTNNPNPLFSATSPFTDLMGVKYILAREPLGYWNLEREIKSHVSSLRWIRFFDGMVTHTINGAASYGFFDSGEEKRFSFFFPVRFGFETKLRVTEPFLFAGFALKDVPEGKAVRVKIRIGTNVTELLLKGGKWSDRWLDISPYVGKVLTVSITGEDGGAGRIIMGDFGLSPGFEKEKTLYERLLKRHREELHSLEYKGLYEGIHVYGNRNVMERAFVLHKTKVVDGFSSVIAELEGGSNFREVGLVTEAAQGTADRVRDLSSHTPDAGSSDRVMITKYSPDEVMIEAESKGGLLVLSDLWYPGWKAKVNNKEEKIVKVFGLFRGVAIGEGRSEVEFVYRPMSLYIGAGISLSTLLIWIMFLWYRKGKEKFSPQ
jgi:hypothetical protein